MHLTQKLTAAFPGLMAPPFRFYALSSQGEQVLLVLSKGKEKPDRVTGFSTNARQLAMSFAFY